MQHVNLVLHLSQPLHVSLGVPQGSVLGPIIFSIFINDYPHLINNSHIHLYADDTILYDTGSSPNAVLKSLQDRFLEIQQSLTNLSLSLNASKTKVCGLVVRARIPVHPGYYR